jgi:hypothetical protein
MAQKKDWEVVIQWIVIGILAVVALKILVSILGIAWVLGGFLLFRVLPIVLVVWLVLKGIEWLRGNGGGSPPATTSDTL